MEKDNEIIAEFMGFPVEYQDLKFTGGYETKKRKLQYDTSWDWLMPVVEKISTMEEVFDAFVEDEGAEQTRYG